MFNMVLFEFTTFCIQANTVLVQSNEPSHNDSSLFSICVTPAGFWAGVAKLVHLQGRDN